jgi:hypothetical protein
MRERGKGKQKGGIKDATELSSKIFKYINNASTVLEKIVQQV